MLARELAEVEVGRERRTPFRDDARVVQVELREGDVVRRGARLEADEARRDLAGDGKNGETSPRRTLIFDELGHGLFRGLARGLLLGRHRALRRVGHLEALLEKSGCIAVRVLDLHAELVFARVEVTLDREGDERSAHGRGREVEPVPEVVDESPVADDFADEVDVEEALLADLLFREGVALEENRELHPHPAPDHLGETEDPLDRQRRGARREVGRHLEDAVRPLHVRLGGRLEVVGQLQAAHDSEARRDRVHGRGNVAVLGAARHVDPAGSGPGAERAGDVSDDEGGRPVERHPEPVVADAELLVEEKEHLRHAQGFDALVVPDLDGPVDVLALDLPEPVRRAVEEEDPAHVRVDVPEPRLGLLQAHLVDVLKRRPHPVGERRAALPELVDEAVALVVLTELQERVALEVRDDRFDVVEEAPVLVGELGRRLLALLVRERLVRDEDRRGGLRLRPGRREEVRHGECAPFREAAVVVALPAHDVPDARRDEGDVGARARVLLEIGERRRLRGRREERRLTLEDRPVAVRARRRLGVEEDARVPAQRRMLEVRPDLDRPEHVGTADRNPGVRRARGNEDDRPVVVQSPEESQRLRASPGLGRRHRRRRCNEGWRRRKGLRRRLDGRGLAKGSPGEHERAQESDCSLHASHFPDFQFGAHPLHGLRCSKTDSMRVVPFPIRSLPGRRWRCDPYNARPRLRPERHSPYLRRLPRDDAPRRGRLRGDAALDGRPRGQPFVRPRPGTGGTRGGRAGPRRGRVPPERRSGRRRLHVRRDRGRQSGRPGRCPRRPRRRSGAAQRRLHGGRARRRPRGGARTRAGGVRGGRAARRRARNPACGRRLPRPDDGPRLGDPGQQRDGRRLLRAFRPSPRGYAPPGRSSTRTPSRPLGRSPWTSTPSAWTFCRSRRTSSAGRKAQAPCG